MRAIQITEFGGPEVLTSVELPAPEMLATAMADLFDRVVAGELSPVVGGAYKLSEVAQAHTDIRARRTTGKLVLDPSA